MNFTSQMGGRIILFLVVFYISISSSPAQSIEDEKTDRFVLQGRIIGKQSGRIYLISRNLNNERIVDRLKIQREEFCFTGYVAA